jgi:AraC-like DNA-binding protein
MNEKSICGKHFEFDNSFFDRPRTYGFIDVHQIGELCCEANYEITEHEQICHELTLVLFGMGESFTNGSCMPIKEGDLILSRKGDRHAMRASPNHVLRYLYLGFMFNDTVDTAGDEIAAMRNFFETSDKAYNHSKKLTVMFPFLRLLDEFYSATDCSGYMIASYCTQILILAYRMLSATEQVSYTPVKSVNSVGHTVYSILQYVENNIAEIKNIRSISQNLGYSYSYISHLFKQRTGMTLQRYICYKKIESAIELMNHGAFTPSQLAAKFNYDSVQAFSKAFNRIIGCSPSQFEKKNSKRRN